MAGDSQVPDSLTFEGRCFNFPEDFQIFNSLPFGISLIDYKTEYKEIIWGNLEALSVFEKKSVDHLREWNINVTSEGMKRVQADIFETVQVRKQQHGPVRRTFQPASGAKIVDITNVPISILCSGDLKPRNVCLGIMMPVSLDEAGIRAACGHYMNERVSSMSMLFVKADGRLIAQNSMARSHYRRLTERPEGDVNLREVLEFLAWDDDSDVDSTMAKIQDLDMGQGALVLERAVKMPLEGQQTQSETWHKLKFEALLDPTPGSREGQAILVSGEDISSQRQAQSDLIRSTHQQEQFFAEMAHELRTPLHCISALAENMAGDRTCPEGLHKNLSIIHSQSMRLTAMVSDIVDSAADMRKTLLIKHEPTALAAVAQSAVDTLRSLAKKGVTLINDVPTDLPPIQADSSRLFQVLVNLLGNAVRFTSKGHVRVWARPAPLDSTTTTPSVELSVSDTGIGIAADKLEGIFGAFHQVDAGTTRKYGGTGLGLALVKTLVEAHHGTVRVDSKTGRGGGAGTTFSIVLPVRQPGAHSEAETEDETPMRSMLRSRSGSGSARDWMEDAEGHVSLGLGGMLASGESGEGAVGGAVSVYEQLAVLDHVSLPAWVVDAAHTQAPTIMWANAVAAALWGAEGQAALQGQAALSGPMHAGPTVDADLYRRVLAGSGTEVVQQYCKFAQGRGGRMDIVLRRLNLGAAASAVILHIAIPSPS